MTPTDKPDSSSKDQGTESRTEPAVPAKKSEKPVRPRKSRFRPVLFGALLLVILIVGIVYFFWWHSDYRSTKDAYVHGNQIFLVPRVTGTVVTINADDTDFVQKGQPLVVLDDSDFKADLLQAEGTLGDTMRKVCQFYVNVRQLKADVQARKVDLARVEDDFRRRTNAQSGTVSEEDITHAHQAADTARDMLVSANQQLAAAEALVARSDLEHHPQVLQAKASVLNASLALQRTTIDAPDTGYVVLRNVQVGQQVTPGSALLAIVPLNQIWVDANYKEAQLKNVRIGQPVTLTSDFYGSSVKYKGHVVGLDPSTGAAFSLLPPDEGSGNWIKIIQRVPVRIFFDDNQLEKFPLRVGLSMKTVVDTRDQSGARLSEVSTRQAVYSTEIYLQEWTTASNLVQSLVATNLEALSTLAGRPSSTSAQVSGETETADE